jgi:hypothetical protein
MIHRASILVAAIVIALTVGACQQAPPPRPEMIPFKLGTLTEAARNTDKGPSLHHYTEVYERFLFDLKDAPVKIFEIGVAQGGSLEMWQEYFPKATITAIDIEPKTKYDTARVKTFVADQANREALKKVTDAAGKDFDILLDDGGHTMEQQQVSLGMLFPYVKPGGYYILEDVHTSIPALWPNYGVAADGSNSTLKMIQDFMGSAPPLFKSTYMTPEELAYLNANVEYANLLYRTDSKSIVCIFRKKTA